MNISPAVMVATPLAAAAVFGTAAYLATEHHVVTPRGEPWPYNVHNLPALLVPAGAAATAGAVMLTTRNGTLAVATLLTGLAGSIAGSLLSMSGGGAEESRAGVRTLASSTPATDIPVAPRDETDHLPDGPLGDTLAPPPTDPPTPDFLPPSSGDEPEIDLPEIDVPELAQPHVPFPDEFPAPPTGPPTPDGLPPQFEQQP